MRRGLLWRSAVLGFLCACLPTLLFAQTWQKTYGGNKTDSGRYLKICDDEGYIVAGLTSSFGAGDSDVYIIRTDKYGNELWNKTIGGSKADLAQCVEKTKDGGWLISGYTKSYGVGNEDVLVIKMSATGDVQWMKTYGGAGLDIAKEAHETTDGGIIVAGYTTSFGAQYFDAMLLKLDASGNQEWVKTYGGNLYENAYSVREVDGGDFLVIGKTYSFGNGDADVYLFRTSNLGTLRWYKTYGGAEEEEGQYITSTEDGNFVFVADAKSGSAGSYDAMAAKISPSGDVIWQKMYGGEAKDVVKTISPTADGGYVISAITRSFGLTSPDFWLIKVNSQGDAEWNKMYGGGNHEHAYGAFQTSDAGYIMVGHESSSGGWGYENVWLVKVDPNGVLSSPQAPLVRNIEFNVNPNPNNGIFRLILQPEEGSTRIELVDVTGKILYREQKETNNERIEKEFNFTGFPKGVYFLQISNGENKSVKKVVLN